MFDIISKIKYAYIFSGILTILSILSLFVWGLNFGIDFKGGTLMEVQFSAAAPGVSEIQEKLKEVQVQDLTIQPSQVSSVILRYLASDETHNEQVLEKLREFDPGAKQLKVDFIGASVSDQIKKNAIWAILLAVVGIALYIAWAFRKVSRPVSSWQYGINAVIALIHDILITSGVFSVLGHFFQVEIGVPFIAALHTSLTVIITLLAIYIFGGESVKLFSLALLIGITFGTYSSIFIASALLVTSYNLKVKTR
ncbi:MAG: hypothetical protein NT136_04025 [Candidatus Moranbacteria bacterium]|nr:hypothetical protein [Candidatus Moranbacteria bacterium]